MILFLLSCLRPECTPASYSEPECRVIAENDLARVRTSDGVEVRFQDPTRSGTDGWAAKGVARVTAEGSVEARVAGLGAFRISVHPGPTGAGTLRVAVQNVHPRTPALAFEIERQGLTRLIEVPLDAGVVEITGDLPPGFCDGGYTVAAVGDIQTNPVHFQRIVDALHDEAAFADAAGKPLAGLVLLGDLAEHSTREELENVDRILRNAPVPTAAIPGNHDIYDVTDALFNETYGPGNHVFDVCSAHFVLLDTGSGGLAPSIVGRLPELLDSDADFLISGTHHPPFAAQSTIGWTREDQAQLLMAELAARNADVMLAGHAHRRFHHESPPVPQLVVGTGGAIQYAVDPDFGYLRMQLDQELQYCFVPVAAPGSLNPVKEGDPETCAELP
ncbi:MAG: metallophosphoesterase [Alphaproteobacteria bacterium]|nr:metallophosphoesterase [Alphaproteobacteria bacterium]